MVKTDTSTETIDTILSSFKKLENFEELHDLKKISEIANISKSFIDNLNSYYEKYVKSFFKTSKQLSTYLSDTDKKKIFDKYVANYNQKESQGTYDCGRTYYDLKKPIVDHWSKKHPKDKTFDKLFNANDNFLYVVNTQESVIRGVRSFFKTSNKITYEIDQNTNRLYARSYWEHHSPFSREWKPIVLDKGTVTLVFDLNNNQLIS